jgi:hypothetical protein
MASSRFMQVRSSSRVSSLPLAALPPSDLLAAGLLGADCGTTIDGGLACDLAGGALGANTAAGAAATRQATAIR